MSQSKKHVYTDTHIKLSTSSMALTWTILRLNPCFQTPDSDIYISSKDTIKHSVYRVFLHTYITQAYMQRRLQNFKVGWEYITKFITIEDHINFTNVSCKNTTQPIINFKYPIKAFL